MTETRICTECVWQLPHGTRTWRRQCAVCKHRQLTHRPHYRAVLGNRRQKGRTHHRNLLRIWVPRCFCHPAPLYYTPEAAAMSMNMSYYCSDQMLVCLRTALLLSPYLHSVQCHGFVLTLTVRVSVRTSPALRNEQVTSLRRELVGSCRDKEWALLTVRICQSTFLGRRWRTYQPSEKEGDRTVLSVKYFRCLR
jgi:ribosomal protein L34